MPALDRDDLVELLSYALLKTPQTVREGLAAPEQHRRSSAEAMLAERILHDMRHLEVSAPPGILPRRSDAGHPSLSLPVTEADLPY